MFTTKNLLMSVGRHLVIALLTISVSLTVVIFLARSIEHVSTTAVKNRQMVRLLEQRTELFTTIKHEAELIGENGTRIENAFVPADNILPFVAALENLSLNNSTPQSFRFGTPISSTFSAPFPLATISFSNTVSANLLTLESYLKQFEKLPYVATIDSMNISSGDTAGWRGAITASFNATLYSRAQ